jgi:hypothetical protein
MSRQTREIGRRRLELVSLADFERQAIADNGLWSSGPWLIAKPVRELGRAIGATSFMYYLGSLLQKTWPKATIRWAKRGLIIWMKIDKMRRNLNRPV